MKIKLDKLTINYIPDDYSNSSRSTIMFLHGFTGSCGDWSFLFDKLEKRYAPVAIDLPGHGESSSPGNINPYLEESIVEMISEVTDKLKISSLVMCGYSMGGRAALSFAARYPNILDGLILESTSPGIREEEQRLRRIEDDNKLANRIEAEGIYNFIDEWYNQPLFKSIRVNAQLYRKLIEGKKNNNPIGLANSLRGFSTGKMNSHWEDLAKLKFPVLLITGENDTKFSKINDDMLKLFPNAEHLSVQSAGHNVHLENEREFIIFLNSFLSNL
jgi:2-succinyl-6-hydroxy-2,4-cyclohexadiene-1-carboxylate synthase